MNGSYRVCVAALTIGGVLWTGASSAAGPPKPGASLYTCQVIVRAQTNTYALLQGTDVGVCLQTIAARLMVANQSPSAAAAVAAPACVGVFRRLNDSRRLGVSVPEVFSKVVSRYCEPGGATVTHTLDDIIGKAPGLVSQPISTKNIDSWCANFGGGGDIAAVSNWIDCLASAASCSANESVATQFPRVLEWLALVRPAMLAQPVAAKDPTRITDAVAALDAVAAAIQGPFTDGKPHLHCGPSPLLASGQPTALAADDDGAMKAGVPLRYRDNGDGTITDLNTGLMWEKKIKKDGTVDATELHDADNCYPWAGACSIGGALCGSTDDCTAVSGGACQGGDCQAASPNGQTIFQWVAQLNAANFAGHSDWRVPNFRELESIVDYGTVLPSIDTAFNAPNCGTSCVNVKDPTCSCTTADSGRDYWSSTTFFGNESYAWRVYFYSGEASYYYKTEHHHVRAVRGGL